jgi:outer membrane protein TolC
VLPIGLVRALGGTLVAALIAAAPAGVGAQTTLTLEEAMARARATTPEARALDAAVEEAAARVRQARSGYLPRVDVSESVQRGNQPVFVFSSLLSQRRFTTANFDVATLNDPPPLTNVRTAVTVEQRVFDAGLTRLGVRAADLGRDLAVLERVRGAQDLALAAAQSFARVLQLEASERATAAAVAAARSDLERARARRDAGVVTEADVLAVDVHLADMRQRQIATAGDLAVARIELNEAVGLPLDQPVTLARPPVPAVPDTRAVIREALGTRPERQQAEVRVSLAENARRTAEAAFLPTVGVQAGWDFNGAAWSGQRSGWLVGAQLHLNLFNGFADTARLAEARQAESRAGADRERLKRRIEVDVRAALTRVDAARARDAAGRAALMQARESQRIIRDRYDSGLATVTDVLRAAEAALDAESRTTAAEMDVILQTVALDRAVGRL